MGIEEQNRLRALRAKYLNQKRPIEISREDWGDLKAAHRVEVERLQERIDELTGRLEEIGHEAKRFQEILADLVKLREGE